MADDVFYTCVELPRNTTLAELNQFVTWAREQRSIWQTRVDYDKVTVYLVVGSRSGSLKYSDCPLPGTHDFSAGWLAHEAMLMVSKKLGRPVEWSEAEWDDQNRRMLSRIKNRVKPPVVIDWATFGE